MSPPDPRGWRCRLCSGIIPDTWVPLDAPRWPCPIGMIYHVSEYHPEEFRRRTDPVPTTDGLKFVLKPLFEPVEDERE